MTSMQKETFLYYKGSVRYDIIGQLIHELKEKMFETQVKQNVYKKVLMAMIEALENVFKYHEFFDKDAEIICNYPPEMRISRFPDKFVIECSNPVRMRDISTLAERLNKILLLDKHGIKESYKKIITNGHFSPKGGAGLGIVEMAKISDEKIEYSFSPINDKFRYYTLKLVINNV
jgi:hypothetical protein